MVRFGLCVPQQGLAFDEIVEVSLAAEKQGYDSVWIYDHLFSFPYPDVEPFLECWTTVTALALKTSRIRVGPLVLNNQYRYPSLVAKMGASLDVISGGRLILGMGAGARPSGRALGHRRLGYEPEHHAYGIPYPEDAITRIKRLREAVKVIKKIWVEDDPVFEGSFYTISHAICMPKPVQKPHPPIWIGGAGVQLLRVVAELADGCNLPWDFTPGECKAKLEYLKGLCRSAGRDYDEIERSVAVGVVIAREEEELKEKISRIREAFDPWYTLNYTPYELRKGCIIGPPPYCIEKIQEFMRAGVTYFIFSFPEKDKKDKIESLSALSEEVLSKI